MMPCTRRRSPGRCRRTALRADAVDELVSIVDQHHQLFADETVEALDHPLRGMPLIGATSSSSRGDTRPKAARTLATFASVLPIWKKRCTTAVRGRNAG